MELFEPTEIEKKSCDFVDFGPQTKEILLPLMQIILLIFFSAIRTFRQTQVAS